MFEGIAELTCDVPPQLSEKYAIFRAVEMAYERGYRRVVVRSDYNAMRKQLKQDIQEGTGWERDVIHTQILQYAKYFDEIHIRYQPRQKNHEAHKLAGKAVKTGRTLHHSAIKTCNT